MILILSPLGYSNLSAFPSLKPSSIDNKYDIPIGIPIETGTTDLSINTKANLQNTTYSLESLPEELQLLESTLSTLATCEKLPVTSVTAIGNDGNIPSNVIDNNLNTRWSNNGVGSWIQHDLGSSKNICSVDIAWYRGDQRTNNFIISVSDDGNSFRDVITTSSAASTTSLQSYALPAGTEGRYVRITVNGNSEGTWASISEIAVTGSVQSHTITLGPLSHKSQTSPGSNAWSSWGSLGGTIRSNSDVSLAMNSDGRLQAFVVGTNNALYYRTQSSPNSNTWSSSWTSLGGGIKADSSPAVAINNDGRLQVFAVGTNNQLYYKTQSSPNSNTWSSAWTFLGGALRDNSDPVVGKNNDGRLEVFQVGAGATTTPPPPPTSTDFPYAFVGSPQDMEDEGWGTRHYASGKPDDITHEWSGETSAQNYAIIIDITLTEIDHDDTISFKFGGTHMGSGWYDNTYSFESGEACIGKEEDHPSTDLCVVTGNSIGNLVNTPVKLAAVNIGKGEKLEMYSNLGSGWTKNVESSNGVDGFRPQVDEDEVNIRIDAAPGIVMRSAQIVEIDPASAGVTTPAPATALTPTSSDKMASTEDDGWTEGDYEGSLEEQEEEAQVDWEDAGRPGDEEDGDDVAPLSNGESRPSS